MYRHIKRLINRDRTQSERRRILLSSEFLQNLERLHQESFGWALGCCSRDRFLAEEVLQIVYLKILEGRARFNGRSSLKTWLFSVIRKTATDERRKQFFRGLLIVQREEFIDQDIESEDISEAIEYSETSALLKHALDSLARRQREELELVFYHDMSLEDVSEVIGLSLGSVRSHYERGKKHLREILYHVPVREIYGERNEHQGNIRTAQAR